MKPNKEKDMKLGTTAKDTITGFTGTITGAVRYLTGCKQYLLQPPVDKSGEYRESRWFDDGRLAAVKAPKATVKKTAANGPDKPAPRR